MQHNNVTAQINIVFTMQRVMRREQGSSKRKEKKKSNQSHLFVKVPRLGDSEGTFSVFESSCHLLLPV